MTSHLPFFLAHIWLIPMFPLITAAAMLFFGRKLKNDVINGLCVGSVFISFIFSAGSFLQLLSLPQDNRIAINVLFEWLPAVPFHMLDGRLANFVADWGFQLDPLSAVMILVVTGVGFLIYVLRLPESLHVRHVDAGARQ
jgi:NADH-quinone oxidoreductase subunit L